MSGTEPKGPTCRTPTIMPFHPILDLTPFQAVGLEPFPSVKNNKGLFILNSHWQGEIINNKYFSLCRPRTSLCGSRSLLLFVGLNLWKNVKHSRRGISKHAETYPRFNSADLRATRRIPAFLSVILLMEMLILNQMFGGSAAFPLSFRWLPTESLSQKESFTSPHN